MPSPNPTALNKFLQREKQSTSAYEINSNGSMAQRKLPELTTKSATEKLAVPLKDFHQFQTNANYNKSTDANILSWKHEKQTAKEYTLGHKPSMYKTAEDLWKTKIHPSLRAHSEGSFRDRSKDDDDRVWTMAAETLSSGRDSLIRPVSKSKLLRSLQITEDTYTLLPSQRKALAEHELQVQRYAQEVKRANSQHVKLTRQMNSRYKSGTLHSDPNSFGFGEYEQQEDIGAQRREYLTSKQKSSIRNFVPDGEETKIFQGKLRTPASDKMISSENLVDALTGTVPQWQSQKRLDFIFSNQTRGRKYDIISGRELRVPSITPRSG